MAGGGGLASGEHSGGTKFALKDGSAAVEEITQSVECLCPSMRT